jgi:hypothetical protein
MMRYVDRRPLEFIPNRRVCRSHCLRQAVSKLAQGGRPLSDAQSNKVSESCYSRTELAAYAHKTLSWWVQMGLEEFP